MTEEKEITDKTMLIGLILIAFFSSLLSAAASWAFHWGYNLGDALIMSFSLLAFFYIGWLTRGDYERKRNEPQ